jgi:hypothetical protein
MELAALLGLTLLFIGFIALAIFLGWQLYKVGKRRATPGWWTAAILGVLSMVLFPFAGFIAAALVLFVDRNST